MVAGLEKTVEQLVVAVCKLESTVCHCHDWLLSLGPHYAEGEEGEVVIDLEEEEGLEYETKAPSMVSYMTPPSTGGHSKPSPHPSCSLNPEGSDPENNAALWTAEIEAYVTGGKGWCPGLVHHKYITRKWTKCQANTHPVYPKFIQNFPSQFSCNFPSIGNGQYIYSVPGHMTEISPLGKSWEHSKFLVIFWICHLGTFLAHCYGLFSILLAGNCHCFYCLVTILDLTHIFWTFFKLLFFSWDWSQPPMFTWLMFICFHMFMFSFT